MILANVGFKSPRSFEEKSSIINEKINKNKELELFEIKKRNFFLNIINNDNEKLKTYYDRSYNKHNFIKTQSQRFFEARNTFMTNFNDLITKEFQLYDNINNNFDQNSLEQYVQKYKNLVNLNTIKPSSTLVKIHKLISKRKDQILYNLINKNEIKTRDQAMNIYNDIKTNNWQVSEKVWNYLVDFLETY